jgi:hypothetical protein
MSENSAQTMPDDPKPGEGERPVWYFLDAKKSVFEWQPKKDAPYERSPFVKGYLKGIWLEWFAGREAANPQDSVPARYQVCVLVQTPDRTALVKIGSAVPYYTLAPKLLKAQEGKVIFLRAVDADNTCFIEVLTHDGQGWVGIMADHLVGEPKEKLSSATKIYYCHLAYKPENEITGPDGGWKAWQAVKGDEDGPPKDVQTSANTSTGGSAPADSNTDPANTTASSGSSSTQSQGGSAEAEKPERKGPAGKIAFGYEPTQWPEYAAFNIGATPKQVENWVTFTAEKGEFSDEERLKIADVILTAYGLERSPFVEGLSKADCQIVLAFTYHAPAEAWAKAVEASKLIESKPVKPPFDPFAEE